MRKENAWDVMNFAWSYNPNRNFDITYYRFKEKTGLLSKMMKKKKVVLKQKKKKILKRKNLKKIKKKKKKKILMK